MHFPVLCARCHGRLHFHKDRYRHFKCGTERVQKMVPKSRVVRTAVDALRNEGRYSPQVPIEKLIERYVESVEVFGPHGRMWANLREKPRKLKPRDEKRIARHKQEREVTWIEL
jgi:hypothetical protein